nr:hypothetical protein [Tanacetum cinerariifolium]
MGRSGRGHGYYSCMCVCAQESWGEETGVLVGVLGKGAELQGRIKRKDDDNAATKEVNTTEPTVFDDVEVTMTMAQTLIKMKAVKARLLDEQMAKRLH